MSELFVERSRLEQEDGEPLHTVRITPDFDTAMHCNGAGVVVVAGEWGLTASDEERFLTPLAELGYFVVGIDLVRGEKARNAEEARAKSAAIDPEIALNDIAAALLYLREMATGKLGVIGLDMGGAIAIEAATVLPQIDAVVHAGGPGPRKGTKLSRTRSSIVIHRGTRDSPLTDEQCADMLERVRPSKAMLITYKYDAPASFLIRPLDEEERNHATNAWDRTRDFLQQQLI